MSMKYSILRTLGIASMTLLTINAYAQEPVQMDNKASYIEMISAEGQVEKFAEFLTSAAPIVKETEPGTAMWFALQAPESKFAIFDTFVDAEARDAHFTGAVAGALKGNAATLVKSGWSNGVVANINNSSVLSAKAPVDLYDATTATYIKLTAAPNQGNALAELLTAAGPIVAETEPKTLYWVALRIDENNFAIFDIFADNAGREAHFAGQVANLLKDNSADLVKGGWNEGVVKNVNNYSILAIK